MKSIFYGKKESEDFEQAKIMAIDRSRGRISVSLRNGLLSTASYLYDISDLRVGLNVVVGRVNGSYVIMNKVGSMDKSKLSYSGGSPRNVIPYDIPKPIIPPVVPPVPPFTGWSDPFDGPVIDTNKWWLSTPPPVIESRRVTTSSPHADGTYGIILLALLGDSFSLSVKLTRPENYWGGGRAGLTIADYPYSRSYTFYYNGSTLYVWLKLVRNATSFSFMYSWDGINWSTYTTQTLWSGLSTISLWMYDHQWIDPILPAYFDDFAFQSGEPLAIPKADPTYLHFVEQG